MVKLKDVEVYVKVDDKGLDFDEFREGMMGDSIGEYSGVNYSASPQDEFVGGLPTKGVWALAIGGWKKDGSYWGWDALFAHGEWEILGSGDILYKVWDRII